MMRYFSRPDLFRKALLLLALCCGAQCRAECTIVNPKVFSLGTSSFFSNALRPSDSARKNRYAFSIKCSESRNYRLSLSDLDVAQPTGTLLLNNGKNDRIVVSAMLKSVNGAEVNLDLGNLPNAYYEGAAVAGQSQEIVLELALVGVKPGRSQPSGGNFQGTGVIRLIY